eukprot:gene15835-18783_t
MHCREVSRLHQGPQGNCRCSFQGAPADTKEEQHAETPSKKNKREVNVAERTSKADKDYTRTPPPSPGKKVDEKPTGGYRECVGCFGGGRHASNQADCWVSCRSARVPEGFHLACLNSPNWKEQQNALMRYYNLANRFPTSEWGITVAEWKKLPDAQKRSAAPSGKGAAASQQASLEQERAGMQAQLEKTDDAQSTSGKAEAAQCYSDEEEGLQGHIDTLLALDELQQLPEGAAAASADQAATDDLFGEQAAESEVVEAPPLDDEDDDVLPELVDGEESDSDEDGDIPLDEEMPPGVIDGRRGAQQQAAAAQVRVHHGITANVGELMEEEDTQWQELSSNQKDISYDVFLDQSLQPWKGSMVQ